MPFNGSGSFSPYTPGNPAVSGTTISSTAFNNTVTDFATGLSNAMTRDGQSPATANIPMGGKKLTGLGDGSAATDAATLGQFAASSGSSLVGYLPAGTGAVATTVQEALRRNAVCFLDVNPALGDMSDITSALNTAASICRTSGRALYLPPTLNYYTLSDTVDLTGIQFIYGQGALLMTNGFTAKPAAIIGGPGATVMKNGSIWLEVQNTLDKSIVAGTRGIKILGMEACKCWLFARGFDDGLYFDGVTATTNWTDNQFNIIKLYNNGNHVNIDLATTSYLVGNQFIGGGYYIGTNQKQAARGTFKITLAASSECSANLVDSAEIGVDGGSANTDHATLVYATVGTTVNTNAMRFRNTRLELYGTFASKIYTVNIPTTTAGRLSVDAEFISMPVADKLIMDIGSLTNHEIFITDGNWQSFGGATMKARSNFNPFHAIQSNNLLFVNGRTLYNADYATPAATLAAGGSRLNRAIGDGRLLLSSGTSSVGVKLKKTVGAPLFLRLSDIGQLVVICYDAAGAVLSGTAPWYAVMRSGRSQVRTGATVYEGISEWLFLHPDVDSFYLGVCAWSGAGFLPDLQYEVLWGPSPTRDASNDTPINIITTNSFIQSYMPSGMFLDATSFNGLRNTFNLSTTASVASVSGASTITVTTVTGIANGDTIGIELDTAIIGSERQYFHTTVSGAPAGSVVTLAATLPDNVAIGRKVLVNRWVVR